MVNKIIIYTGRAGTCPFCVKAKKLLEEKNLEYQEFNIDDSSELMEEMIRKSSGRRSVPQIFINGQHVGGYDDLALADQSGKLIDFLE